MLTNQCNVSFLLFSVPSKECPSIAEENQMHSESQILDCPKVLATASVFVPLHVISKKCDILTGADSDEPVQPSIHSVAQQS